MKKEYQKIINLIKDEKRNEAVLYSLKLLKDNEISIVTLFEDVLAKALNSIGSNLSCEECIWMEHVQTSIVRTIVEASYPYVIEEMEKSNAKNKKVLVVCPSEEYHEIGAKIIHNFFLIAGYDATFIGANTPQSEIISASQFIKPDYVALSVTNYYNIFKATRIVDALKNKMKDTKIIIGGSAFFDENARNQITHDYYLTTYQDIVEMGEE